MDQEQILSVVKECFSHPETKVLMIDEHVVNYLSSIILFTDFQSPDSFPILAKIVSPIITNLGVTANNNDAEGVLQELYNKCQRNTPQVANMDLDAPVSAQQFIIQQQQMKQKYNSLQEQRDLYQQQIEYAVQKQNEKQQLNLAKRILKGKSTAFSEDMKAPESAQAQMSQQYSKLRSGIELNQISLAFGENKLLEDCTAAFVFGHRYCLIARNGAGKSTLLRAIYSNEIHCIANRENLNVLYVSQEVPSSEDLVIDVVLSANENYVRLNRLQLMLERILDDTSKIDAKQAAEIRELAQLGSQIEITEDHINAALENVCQQQYEQNFNSARMEASKILAGLQFTPLMQGRPTKELSGGWKMRVALARALFINPDILMLDEPTNNLDLNATLWLEEWLSTFSVKKLLIVVSHDISFIDSFATDIVLMINKGLKLYQGNYSAFARARASEATFQNKMAEKEQAHRAHVESFINRFRYNAKRASLVQSRIKALDKLEHVELSAEQVESFEFPQPYPDGFEHNHQDPLIELQNANFSYSASKLGGFKLTNINFRIFSDSRIALCGANAAGKSTLLKLICGFIQPNSGEVQRNKEAICAVFWQHHQDQLDMNSTPFLTLQKFCPGQTEAAYRAHLQNFGIGQNMVHQVNRTLSGGQKTRLSLSLLTFNTRPRILVLDELTNHIDIETKQALIEALQLYNGAIVVVSHDGPFISSVTDELYVIDGGSCNLFDGEFDDYKEMLKRQYRK